MDREAMELEGYFFLELAMIPSSWAGDGERARSIEPEQYRGPDVVWWRHDAPAIEVCLYCDQKWDRGDPRGWYLRDDIEQISWVDQENHRIEIVLDANARLTDFAIAIDIRTAFSDFVNELIELARVTRCVFFDYENSEIIEPTRQRVLQLIQRHEMNHVVFDPSGKLALN